MSRTLTAAGRRCPASVGVSRRGGLGGWNSGVAGGGWAGGGRGSARGARGGGAVGGGGGGLVGGAGRVGSGHRGSFLLSRGFDAGAGRGGRLPVPARGWVSAWLADGGQCRRGLLVRGRALGAARPGAGCR